MIACPVCEHQQVTGSECEVCGKRFAPGIAEAAPVAPIDGLEPTSHERREGTVVETIPELVPTREAPVDVVEDATPGVEATRAAPVDAEAEPLADIERIGEPIPGDGPSALPVAPVCRYCRTPAVPGERLCSRCGMRLPVIDATLVPRSVDGVRLCTNCGSLTTRELCPACGNRLTSSTLE